MRALTKGATDGLRISLAHDFTVEKTRDQEQAIVVRGTGHGLEIVAVR